MAIGKHYDVPADDIEHIIFPRGTPVVGPDEWMAAHDGSLVGWPIVCRSNPESTTCVFTAHDCEQWRKVHAYLIALGAVRTQRVRVAPELIHMLTGNCKTCFSAGEVFRHQLVCDSILSPDGIEVVREVPWTRRDTA
jgi:hypothetical protein